MENASKALLIAAAILLAILLITIGITVYRTATNSIGDVGAKMSSTQIQGFNQQFESYVSKAASYKQAQDLVALVGRVSGTGNNDYDATVTVTGTPTAGSTHKIEVKTSNSGLINEVIITPNN